MNPPFLPNRVNTVFLTTNAIFLDGNNQSECLLLGLAAWWEGLPWGEGWHEGKLGVQLVVLDAAAALC